MLKEEEYDNIQAYHATCALKYCTINGVKLDYKDFGEQYDTEPDKAEDYGCGNMQFIPYKEVKQDALKKYNITEEEYRKIQDRLDCLSFGCCDYCV